MVILIQRARTILGNVRSFDSDTIDIYQQVNPEDDSEQKFSEEDGRLAGWLVGCI